MEYSKILNKKIDSPEIEKEVIVCDDENLMKYLVEVTEILLESIWRSSQIIQPRLCPLHDYICHVIRQSKISLYTLKSAIIYFIRISRQLQDKRWRSKIRLFCGRRMFLGSIIIASKYLYDRSYSNLMWAKILGLDIKEVNNIQMDFLETINYDLYISVELDSIWSQMLENFIAYLKAKHDQDQKTILRDQFNNCMIKKDVLASPLNSPVMAVKNMSNHSLMPGVFKNLPNSPISPASSVKTINSMEEGEVNGTSKEVNEKHLNMENYQVYIMNQEMKRLEEYRPFVKVLIQVIFMYGNSNTLPVGKKTIIELPKLAVTPHQLFANSYPDYPMRCSSSMVHNNGFSFLQLKRRLGSQKLSRTQKVQLYIYYFNKAFPNRHLLNQSLARRACTSGYYSDGSSRHSSFFHYYRGNMNYHRVREANNRLSARGEILNSLLVDNLEYPIHGSNGTTITRTNETTINNTTNMTTTNGTTITRTNETTINNTTNMTTTNATIAATTNKGSWNGYKRSFAPESGSSSSSSDWDSSTLVESSEDERISGGIEMAKKLCFHKGPFFDVVKPTINKTIMNYSPTSNHINESYYLDQ